MPTEYDEELGYDADHEDPSQYCIHGRWIGSWWGPDYLCQACEDGLTLLQWQRIGLATRVRRIEATRAFTWIKMIDGANEWYKDRPYNSTLATRLTMLVLEDPTEFEQAIRQCRRAKAALRLHKHKFPDVERQLNEAYA